MEKKGIHITAHRDRRDPKWVRGTAGKYTFEATVFDTPSHFGINEGRVSKLWVWDAAERKTTGNCFNDIIAYDRGWDHEPGEDHAELFKALIGHLEKMDKSPE